MPDADTHLLKAQLVSRVREIIQGRKLTQAEAAKILGVSQLDISRMLKGQFRDLSVERLMVLLRTTKMAEITAARLAFLRTFQQIILPSAT